MLSGADRGRVNKLEEARRDQQRRAARWGRRRRCGGGAMLSWRLSRSLGGPAHHLMQGRRLGHKLRQSEDT